MDGSDLTLRPGPPVSVPARGVVRVDGFVIVWLGIAEESWWELGDLLVVPDPAEEVLRRFPGCLAVIRVQPGVS